MSSDAFIFPDEAVDETAEEQARSSDQSPPDESRRETLLRVEDLEVSFGGVAALDGIDLHVDAGEVVSILGSNGAGKTTFVDAATGLLEYEGSVRYKDAEVADRGPRGLIKDGLLQCPAERELFGGMTVEDNLRLGAYAIRNRSVIREQRSLVYSLFPQLEDRADQAAATLSGGGQQLLALGRSVMGAPELLVLEEPTLGLTPDYVDAISYGIEQLVADGVTVVLCEQNGPFALSLANRVYLLDDGSVQYAGPPAGVRAGEQATESSHVG